VLLINITRLASKEISSPSNKIHREVGRAKDLSAPLYCLGSVNRFTFPVPCQTTVYNPHHLFSTYIQMILFSVHHLSGGARWRED
jgi:hypothetical protein